MVHGPKKNDLPMRILSALVMLPVAIYIILSGGMVYFIFLALLGGVIRGAIFGPPIFLPAK